MEFINSSVILARITICIRTLLYVGSTSPAVNTRWAFKASGECGVSTLFVFRVSVMLVCYHYKGNDCMNWSWQRKNMRRKYERTIVHKSQ